SRHRIAGVDLIFGVEQVLQTGEKLKALHRSEGDARVRQDVVFNDDDAAARSRQRTTAAESGYPLNLEARRQPPRSVSQICESVPFGRPGNRRRRVEVTEITGCLEGLRQYDRSLHLDAAVREGAD